MKTFKLIPAFAAALLGMFTQACSDSIEWSEGEGLLKLKMVVDSNVTRAEVDDEQLAENCVLYISNSKGLLHKFQGLSNVPDDLWLKSGNYVGEAWTGDSVSASFDKKFYRGYQPFEIHEGVNNVVLTCKIANVVASVNVDNISPELMTDWNVNIANTAASLDFNSENVADAHGYYMMPNGDTTLTYTITGKNLIGTEFTKTGTIENVQRAHEYVLNLTYNPDGSLSDAGGAFITVTIDDTALLIEDEIMLHAAPRIEGLGVDIDAPLAASRGKFNDLYIGGVCHGAPKEFSFKFSDAAAFGMASSEYNLLDLADVATSELSSKNITWNIKTENDHSQIRVNFPAAIFNNLPNGSYLLSITIADLENRVRTKDISIEVSDAKVIAASVPDSDINSYSATLKISVVDDNVTNPGIRYREKGTADWTEAFATRATEYTFHLTGLKPGTRYEYQAIADGYVNTEMKEFTTFAMFVLPNGGFENWSKAPQVGGNKQVTFPGSGNEVTFWDSGNHGSMTMNKEVTSQATSPVHGGSSSICLQSQFVGIGTIGKFAAGNVFAGSYVGTDGTDGILSFGRPMTKCFPTSLAGYINYRPQEVQWSDTSLKPKGSMDEGSIYVAVTTQPVEIRTKTKQLFDKNADYVLAYGEKFFPSSVGADGGMAEFSIPLTWKKRDYNGQYYIVIVASASRYGDYFTGGNSVMYLDDLVLTYE